MSYVLHASGAANELRVQRMLRTVAQALRGHLDEGQLSADLVIQVHSCIHDLLAVCEVPDDAHDARASGLVNEIALAIFLVVVGCGHVQTDTALLLSLEQAIEEGLVQCRPLGGDPASPPDP